MPTVQRFVTGAALAGALAVAGGCGSSARINPHQVEADLLASLRRQRPGVIFTARCPTGVVLKVGAEFTCTVTFDGTPTSYTVQVSSISQSEAKISTRPTDPVIDTDTVIDAIRTKLGPGSTASCPTARFVQLQVHKSLTCTATVKGQQQTVTATLEDDQGYVSFSSEPVTTTTTPPKPGATLPVS